jgi:redox-sensitive bicupin YhaK (pirin superfamily)
MDGRPPGSPVLWFVSPLLRQADLFLQDSSVVSGALRAPGSVRLRSVVVAGAFDGRRYSPRQMATESAVLEKVPLGFPWVTLDPFLFCVHHDDAYPKGNELLGPDPKLLVGRNLGQDFEIRDGFRMYHGEVVPGFPQHPHRGFETVTIARRGHIDHSDSLGAAARFGRGDVQWVTAGSGIVHSEMFPLLDPEQPNPVELFQIWMNLPKSDKMVAPHFTMLWSRDIPVLRQRDADERAAEVTVIAGELFGKKAPPPPPHSWAARPTSDVGIYSLRLQPGATFTLPRAAGDDTARTVYFFRGEGLTLGGETIRDHAAIGVNAQVDLPLRAGGEDGAPDTEILVLQGKPIGEPVAHYGPFVMNTSAELEQAVLDYRATRFGGWPWPKDDPVHPRDAGRFAKHGDGRVEKIEG